MRAEVRSKVKIALFILIGLSALASTISSPILYGEKADRTMEKENSTASMPVTTSQIGTTALTSNTTTPARTITTKEITFPTTTSTTTMTTTTTEAIVPATTLTTTTTAEWIPPITELTTTMSTTTPCIPKLWFAEQTGQRSTYQTIKCNCMEFAKENNATVGYPSFFRNEREYYHYLTTIPKRKEYLGYEQQNGDNSQWLNADGSEVTFTDWDTHEPNNHNEECVQIHTKWSSDTVKWHDIKCNNADSSSGAFYSCRFEIIC